jgi:hypothetical protein
VPQTAQNINDPIGFLTASGTNLETAQCPPGSDTTSCMAAFLGLHLTSGSSAYLEVCYLIYSLAELTRE